MKLSTSKASEFDAYELFASDEELLLRRTFESSVATERRIDEKELSRAAEKEKLTCSANGLNCFC